MTPGAATGPAGDRPGESPEVATGGIRYDNGDKIALIRDLCTKVRQENKESEKKYAETRDLASKNRLIQALLRKAQNENIRRQLGIANIGEVETYLTEQGCFDNLLIGKIDDDRALRAKVRNELITNTLDKIQGEYPALTAEQRSKLETSFEREDNNGRIRAILENYKLRKSFVKRELQVDISVVPNITFDGITEKILKLDPTLPNAQKIQDSWRVIMSLAQPGETLKDAFQRIAKEGRPADYTIAGAYETFFSDENTCIAQGEKEEIRSFLVKQFTPVIPYKTLLSIAPAFTIRGDELLGQPQDIPETVGTFAEEIQRSRAEEYNAERQRILDEDYFVDVSKLDPKLQTFILGMFGNVGRSEQILEYSKGFPNSLRNGTGTYRDNFDAIHHFYPEKLETQQSLVAELEAKMGDRIKNIEHFKSGGVMEYHSDDKGNDVVGYFWIDDIADTHEEDNLAEDGIIKIRWLGNNQAPLKVAGTQWNRTPADFFHFLASGDGQIVFRDGDEFNDSLKGRKDLPRYESQEDIRDSFYKALPEENESMSEEVFQKKVDEKFQAFHGNKKKEIQGDAEKRALREGSLISLYIAGEMHMIHVRYIDYKAGTITLSDGQIPEKPEGPDNMSVMTISLSQFLGLVDAKKNEGAIMTRLPTGTKFGVEEFNALIQNDAFNQEFHNKISPVRIHNGKFGQWKSGEGFVEFPILKIKGKNGKARDIWIKSIDDKDGTAEVMMGEFKNHDYDKSGKLKKKGSFKGSPRIRMPLANLYAYIQSNINFQFEKPKERPTPEIEQKPQSWFNILFHAHSLGVILHGDLWKAPYKAWEEHHHKEHAFHGKMTAALAIEKLTQGKGPAGAMMRWFDWPAYMISESNNSFQSYLDELVQKIDDMSSSHRAKLITKWGSYHFPDVKFMAAMLGSLQVFGQLYPRDGQFDKDNKPKAPWFWYNNIVHALHRDDLHIPPAHGKGKPIPDDETEIQAIIRLASQFQHPILADIKRRVEKYVAKGYEKNKDGGKSNLELKERMEDKYEWMLSSALGNSRPMEMLGNTTAKMWLEEGYDTATTTGPYYAWLLAGGEQNIPPQMQDDIYQQFREQSIKIPPLIFGQSKNLGDTFRDACITFAYTISKECGDTMAELAEISKEFGRIPGNKKKEWRAKFEPFWSDYGKRIVERMTGMRDPMLQLIIHDEDFFDGDLYASLPEGKKKQYERLKIPKHRDRIRLYYERLKETNSGATYAALKESEGVFYKGEHFRFRSSFETGWPMGWMDWNGYFDANGVTNYFSDQYKSDGIFKEVRAFIGELPRLAERMVDDMEIRGPNRQKMIDEICKRLYQKNAEKIKPEINKCIKTPDVGTAYACVPAMILGIADLKRFSPGNSADQDLIQKMKGYEDSMRDIIKTAERMEAAGNWAEAIRYRARMWEHVLEKIEQNKEPHELLSGEEENGVKRVTSETRGEVSGTIAPKVEDFITLVNKKKGS